MTDIERVHLFLRQVRRRALLVFGLRAAGFTAAAMLATVLLLALTATWIGPAASWSAVTVMALLALLLSGFGLVWGLPARRLRSPRAMAAFAGQRHPPLASDLMSAVELDVEDHQQQPSRVGSPPASPAAHHRGRVWEPSEGSHTRRRSGVELRVVPI